MLLSVACASADPAALGSIKLHPKPIYQAYAQEFNWHLFCATNCGGTRVGTGRRLLTALTQVRFLPPQLQHDANGRASQQAMAAASKAVEQQTLS
jgi:hypothetical protein